MTIFSSMVQVIICAIVDQYLIALYWNMIIKRMCMWLGFSMHHIPACMTYVIHFKYRQSIQHHTHHLKTLHLIPSSSRWIKAKKDVTPLLTHWRWSCVFLARAQRINDERHLYSQFHSQSDKIWLPVSPLAAMPEYMTTECQFWQSHAKTDHPKSVTGKINPLD